VSARFDDAPHGAHGAVLARGAVFNTLAFLASNLRGIFTFLVARLLGGAVLGTFGLAWAATDLVSKIGTCGFDTGAIAAVARREAVGDVAGSRRVMNMSLRIALGVSVALAVVGAAAAWAFGARLTLRPELSRATAVMLLGLPGIVLYRVSNALSRGKGVMHHDIYSRGFTESLGTAAALLIALALGARDLAPEIAAIAGTLAAGVVAFLCARGLFVSAPPSDDAPGERGILIRASAPVAVYDLLNIGIMQIDLIMLGLFVGRAPGVTLESLGVYAAAMEVAGGLRKVNQAFNPIFIPVVAQQLATGRLRDAESSYGYLARWMLAVLLPAIALLSLAGTSLMSIYGPLFRSGGVWVAVLAGACALNAFVGLGETILMVQYPRVNMLNSTIALGAAIALNLVLIPRFGPLGAALGMLVPYGVQGVLRSVEMTWLLGWQWPWRALARPWMAALAALPLALLVRLFGGGVWGEVAAAATYAAGYLAAWRSIGLDESDRDVLAHFFSRRTAVAETA
jgi:O-antigen/teichoic acid export membrane protein